MLLEMVKVVVLGHRRALEATVARLQRLAVLHVVDLGGEPELGASPLVIGEARSHELERLRSLRSRVEALRGLLPAPGPGAESAAVTDPVAVAEWVDERLPAAERAAAQIAELEAEARTLPRHLASLRRLSPLAEELGLEADGGDAPAGYETMALLVDRQHGEVLATLRAELDTLAEHRFEMTSALVDRDTIGALLVFPQSLAAAIHARLGGERVSRVRLPEPFRGLSFGDSLERMEARLAAIPAEIATLRGELAARGALDFEAAARVVSERLDQLELMRRLGGSEHAFVIAGWLPRRELGRLEGALAELDDEVAAIEIAPRAGEEPPVALANSRAARPFERLVRLFGLPQARSIDPSGLMSVFMPLFFGMMVGDVGHGVILLAGALAARRRWRDRPMIRDLARILALGAGWSVVWGLVFGELFGELGAHYLHLSPLWISRSDSRAVSSLLVFSLGVGAVHIALGLVLGIWSAARARHRSELCERAGQLVSLVGLFSVAGVISRQLPAGLMTPSFAAIAVGMVLVGATKGWLGLLLGPLDVLSGAGNVLSYLRIAALGMASVYLSQVANELGRAAPAVIGAVVATLLHALNVALASFSPTIQALRLHYVEFFGKFYDVGGAPYRPFGAAVADAET